MEKRRVVIAILAGGWVTLSQAGGVYKCIDEQGRIHYADRPCRGVVAQETVEIKSRSSSNPLLLENGRQAKQKELLQTWQEERKQKQQAEEEARKQKEQRSRNCAAAKSRLHLIESARRLFKMDENGERHYYSDSERTQKLQEAQKQVNKWCSP
ncbi:conserved hypothetical protein [Nitrosococcus halophilus Nc 4]|uniref:DUF4124 domain-containing protein n=1 Tax=Nitrosococcus halophilus (strain Nc4) TaxID=472759 RepID=D5BVH5_NITHN|nr:DUF4124 domain-containing protein [Nitrosococcus halophilus]ADE13603.1 conserved hypothetical protein [Nitrosococcus halophilus Nc 4]